jgi:glycosyltransferase involved in cell wall biosynthesis
LFLGGDGRGEQGPPVPLGVPKERVTIADQYRVLYEPYSHNQMAKVYSAMDVLLNPSMGEGFGIPVLEAQACGVPAVVTNFSAMTEVCGAGWRVGFDRAWTGQNSWMAAPHVSEIEDALEECYGLSGSTRSKLSAGAVKHAQQYDVRRVLKQHWLPALRTIERRFGSQEPIRIPSRARVAA